MNRRAENPVVGQDWIRGPSLHHACRETAGTVSTVHCLRYGNEKGEEKDEKIPWHW